MRSPISPPRSLAFEELEIDELERQARGTVHTDAAIGAQQRVFTDAQGWHDFWSPFERVTLPEIDFREQTVVGIFLGATSPGHGVRVQQVVYDETRQLTSVRYVRSLPDPSKTYPAVVVYPSVVVKFPRLPGTVEVREPQSFPPESR